ncbi:hypothetical protein ACNSPG_06450 [Brucella pituitosa]|uniref:hypothetical protein n=1 Tax=Brucella pituitosa TaxID=571256 RepID=UPI003C714F20
MANELIAAAISEHYGERCPDFDADCFCCKAWAEYDALTRPAAPVEVLDRYNLNASFDGPGDAFCAAVKSKKGVFVRFDQAKAIIAAEREAQQRLLDIIEEANTDKSALDADNAALTARVKAQIEHIATLDSNLEAMEKRAQEGETQLAAARKALSVMLSEYDELELLYDEPASMVSAVEAARAALEDCCHDPH